MPSTLLDDHLKRDFGKKIKNRMDRCEKEIVLLKQSNENLKQSHRQLMDTISELQHRLNALEKGVNQDDTSLSRGEYMYNGKVQLTIAHGSFHICLART